MADRKILLGNVRGEQGPAGPNLVSKTTQVSGFSTGQVLYVNGSVVGAKALTAADVGAASAAQGMATYIHSKSGTVHNLTGSGENIRFVAGADFAAGDTFSVNGAACTAKTAGGDALWAGFFKKGAVVVCWRTGNALTFNGGGLPAGEAAKLVPENIKTGVSITANGKTVAGTFTADATATAADVAPGKTAYSKGAKVTGMFTSDANAIGGDLRSGKTAYVNGKKVTGSIPSRDTGTPNWCEYVRLANGRFEIAPPAGIHGCWWDGGQYSYLSYDQVRNVIGLTAAKIVAGNTILGLGGTGRTNPNIASTGVVFWGNFDKTIWVKAPTKNCFAIAICAGTDYYTTVSVTLRGWNGSSWVEIENKSDYSGTSHKNPQTGMDRYASGYSEYDLRVRNDRDMRGLILGVLVGY